MPDLSTLSFFAVACLAFTATPGPDMSADCLAQRRPRPDGGFATLAGIQAIGAYCHALAAAFGLSQLFLVVPIAYDAIRYIGAAYLLYLAWQTFRSNGAVLNPALGLPRHPVAQTLRPRIVDEFAENPKMALFVLALFPQFVQTETGGNCRANPCTGHRTQPGGFDRERVGYRVCRPFQEGIVSPTVGCAAFRRSCSGLFSLVWPCDLRWMSVASITFHSCRLQLMRVVENNSRHARGDRGGGVKSRVDPLGPSPRRVGHCQACQGQTYPLQRFHDQQRRFRKEAALLFVR